ncbi:MAG: hypothetical protein ACR2NZ_03050, partial [Rubripirellula sp.]
MRTDSNGRRKHFDDGRWIEHEFRSPRSFGPIKLDYSMTGNLGYDSHPLGRPSLFALPSPVHPLPPRSRRRDFGKPFAMDRLATVRHDFAAIFD